MFHIQVICCLDPFLAVKDALTVGNRSNYRFHFAAQTMRLRCLLYMDNVITVDRINVNDSTWCHREHVRKATVCLFPMRYIAGIIVLHFPMRVHLEKMGKLKEVLRGVAAPTSFRA